MTPRTGKKDCRENSCCSMLKSVPGDSQIGNVITLIGSYQRRKIRLVTSRKRREFTTRAVVLRNTQRVKLVKKIMNKRRGRVSGSGVV